MLNADRKSKFPIIIEEEKIGDSAAKEVAKIMGLPVGLLDKIHSHQWAIVADGLRTNKSVEVTKFFFIKVIPTTVTKMLDASLERIKEKEKALKKAKGEKQKEVLQRILDMERDYSEFIKSKL